MRNYGVSNTSHSQCALIDEGQVEIRRRGRERERERKRQRERERERERKKRKERERERRGGEKWKKFIQKPLYISPLNLVIA